MAYQCSRSHKKKQRNSSDLGPSYPKTDKHNCRYKSQLHLSIAPRAKWTRAAFRSCIGDEKLGEIPVYPVLKSTEFPTVNFC